MWNPWSTSVSYEVVSLFKDICLAPITSNLP